MATNILDAIKQLKEGERKKFSQSFDLIINVQNIDLKKPDSRFVKDVQLPHGKGKVVKVCVISEKSEFDKDFIQRLDGDKKSAKKFCKSYDFFLCEAPLMVLVGKVLGRYLGPSGKMPKLLPPNTDHGSMSKTLERSVRIRLSNTPVVQCIVGNETLEDQKIKDNVDKVVEEVKKALPAKASVKNVYIKLTMSKPVMLDIK